MKSRIALIALGLAMLPASALAQQPMFSDNLSVIYADGTIFGSGTSEFKFANSAFVSFERPGLNLQVDAADRRVSGGGISGDLFSLGASLFWRGHDGTIGLTIDHDSVGGASVTSYGLFGEWYATDNLSLRLKGGGFNGSGVLLGGSSGGFAGAGGEIYLWRELGIHVSYTYVGISGGHVHDVEGGIDWQVSDDYPLVASLGVDSFQFGGAYARSFKFGLTYRLGVRGSLVGIDRLAATDWKASLPGL